MVNIVDTGAARRKDKAKDAGLPVVFWNREPENANIYDTYENPASSDESKKPASCRAN